MNKLSNRINLYSYILSLNSLLRKRVNRNQFSNLIGIGIGSFFSLLLTTIILFAGDPFNSEVKFGSIIYLMIAFDLIFILTKIAQKSIIEPRDLEIYPLSDWVKLKIFILSITFDYKSFPFFLIGFVFSMYLFVKVSIIASLLSILCWFLILVSAQIWHLVLFYSFENYIYGHRKKISSFGFIPLVFFAILENGDLYILQFIPIVSQGENLLSSLFTLNIESYFLNIIYMLLVISLGCIIVRLIPKIKSGSY